MPQESPVAGQAAPSGDAQGKKNQRKTPRHRVLKEGKVVFGQSHSVVDCTIDNMSDGGAHIRITSSHGVPEDFFLVEANRGIIHRVEVAWRTTTGLGLRIVGPLDDAEARASLMRKFRRG